jgi:predicted Fe-Mo cluster-binding NifX family protein
VIGDKHMKVAIPSNTPGGPDGWISPHLGRCDVFTIVEIKNGKMTGWETLDNQGTHFGFGARPAEILASSGVDVVMAQGMGGKALELLEQSGIRTYFTSARTVGEAVRELTEGKARPATPEEACKE